MNQQKQAWIEPDGKGWKRIAVSFPYDKQTITLIKTLPGRKYNKKYTRWFAPICPSTLNSLSKWGFIFSSELIEWHGKYGTKKITVNDNKNINGLLGVLRLFQKEGVNAIHLFGGRALLADEMGLGKTVQALAYLQHKVNLRPAIIVMPASLKLNWRDEIMAWMKDADPIVLEGRTPYKIKHNGLILINYDIVDAWKDQLFKLKPQAILLDECHYIMNAKALRSKAVRKIQKNAKCLIAISGTPFISKPKEFWNILNMVRPDIFYSWLDYMNRYCGPKKTPWGRGIDYTGHSNMGELNKILKEHIMIRRLKKNVLKELPPKIRTVIPLDCGKENYRKAVKKYREWCRGYKIIVGKDGKETREYNDVNPARAMVELQLVKVAAAKDKLKDAFVWIDDYLMNNDKLVVFAHHKVIIDSIMERYKHIAVKVVGGMTPKQKNDAKNAFQRCATCGANQDKHHLVKCKKYVPDLRTRLFVGSKSAKEGLTLTAANATAFLEFWWANFDHDQAEDRVHRIGQKSDSVVAYYLINAGTIEEKIMEFIDNKRTVTTGILDGVSVDNKDMLVELMKEFYD